MMSDGWIEWNGGECPVPGDTVVDIKFADSGSRTDVRAGVFDWVKDSNPYFDIIAYRIVQPTQYSDIKSDGGFDPRNKFDAPTDAHKTLRDEFAMAALPEFLTLKLADVPTLLKRFPKAKNSEDLAAILSYVVADAMMEARKK